MTRLVSVRVVCDGCRSAAAIVYCVGARRALCAACSRGQSTHARVELARTVTALAFCEHCDDAPAHVYCAAEDASLCRACDASVHFAKSEKIHDRRPIRVALTQRTVSFTGGDGGVGVGGGRRLGRDSGGGDGGGGGRGGALVPRADKIALRDSRGEDANWSREDDSPPATAVMKLNTAVPRKAGAKRSRDGAFLSATHENLPTSTATAASPPLLPLTKRRPCSSERRMPEVCTSSQSPGNMKEPRPRQTLQRQTHGIHRDSSNCNRTLEVRSQLSRPSLAPGRSTMSHRLQVHQVLPVQDFCLQQSHCKQQQRRQVRRPHGNNVLEEGETGDRLLAQNQRHPASHPSQFDLTAVPGRRHHWSQGDQFEWQKEQQDIQQKESDQMLRRHDMQQQRQRRLLPKRERLHSHAPVQAADSFPGHGGPLISDLDPDEDRSSGWHCEARGQTSRMEPPKREPRLNGEPPTHRRRATAFPGLIGTRRQSDSSLNVGDGKITDATRRTSIPVGLSDSTGFGTSTLFERECSASTSGLMAAMTSCLDDGHFVAKGSGRDTAKEHTNGDCGEYRRVGSVPDEHERFNGSSSPPDSITPSGDGNGSADGSGFDDGSGVADGDGSVYRCGSGVGSRNVDIGESGVVGHISCDLERTADWRSRSRTGSGSGSKDGSGGSRGSSPSAGTAAAITAVVAAAAAAAGEMYLISTAQSDPSHNGAPPASHDPMNLTAAATAAADAAAAEAIRQIPRSVVRRDRSISDRTFRGACLYSQGSGFRTNSGDAQRRVSTSSGDDQGSEDFLDPPSTAPTRAGSAGLASRSGDAASVGDFSGSADVVQSVTAPRNQSTCEDVEIPRDFSAFGVLDLSEFEQPTGFVAAPSGPRSKRSRHLGHERLPDVDDIRVDAQRRGDLTRRNVEDAS